MSRAVSTPLVAFATLLAASLLADLLQTQAPRCEEDVLRAAECQGLFWVLDSPPHSNLKRIVLSRTPITADEARSVLPNRPEPGRLVAYVPGHVMTYNFDPEHTCFWGAVYLYGDPALIGQLTGSRVEG